VEQVGVLNFSQKVSDRILSKEVFLLSRGDSETIGDTTSHADLVAFSSLARDLFKRTLSLKAIPSSTMPHSIAGTLNTPPYNDIK